MRHSTANQVVAGAVGGAVVLLCWIVGGWLWSAPQSELPRQDSPHEERQVKAASTDRAMAGSTRVVAAEDVHETVDRLLSQVAELEAAVGQNAKEREEIAEREEIYLLECTTPAGFDAALGVPSLVADFDNVRTYGLQPTGFESDLYTRGLGLVIEGVEGQFVSRFNSKWTPASEPNMYAPGPLPHESETHPAGGCETLVSFRRDGKPAAVAGFGAVFVDADYPKIGPCSITAYGADSRNFGTVKGILSANNQGVFRGIVALNEAGFPAPVIYRVRIVNGNEWPTRGVEEGVALDDFRFPRPELREN